MATTKTTPTAEPRALAAWQEAVLAEGWTQCGPWWASPNRLAAKLHEDVVAELLAVVAP